MIALSEMHDVKCDGCGAVLPNVPGDTDAVIDAGTLAGWWMRALTGGGNATEAGRLQRCLVDLCPDCYGTELGALR